MGRCVFCGWEGKLTNEHAWPDWIREVLPAGHMKGHSQQHRVAASTGEVTAITPVLHEKAATRRVKVVCQDDCNGGWMSDLEHTAKPLLVPMIFGETSRLTEQDQTTIAFWVAKTAMMLQFLHPIAIRAIPGRGGLYWPRRGGLKWPHFASVVVCVLIFSVCDFRRCLVERSA